MGEHIETATVEVVKQVAANQTEYIDRFVPRIEVQPVEKSVEVPVRLRREIVQEVPQQQMVETLVEQLNPSVQQVQKHVPSGSALGESRRVVTATTPTMSPGVPI